MAATRTFEQLKVDLGQRFPALSPQLQRIASHALEHPQEMALDTVARIAKATGAQPSALVRFAQALGFDGFSDLQQVFRNRLVERSTNRVGQRDYRERIAAFRAGHPPSGALAVLDQFINDGIGSLEQLHEQISATQLEAAVKVLLGARSIHVLGHRRAFPVAYYLAYALAQLALPARLLDSVGGMLREPARLIGTDDVLFVISFRNYTAEVIDVAAECHARGVPVIAMTDSAFSPLARCASICFQIEEGSSKPFRMLVAPMCLAQTLVVASGESLTESRGKRGARVRHVQRAVPGERSVAKGARRDR